MGEQDPFQKPNNLYWQAIKKFCRQQKLFWPVLAGVFVIIGVVLFLQYQAYQETTSDHLNKFVPVNSVLYISVKDTVWPGPTKTIKDLPLANFYSLPQISQVFSGVNLKEDFLQNSSQAALAMVPGQNDQLDWIFIFELKNQKAVQPALAKLPNHLFLNGNILVVAKDKEILDKVNSVASGKTFSLATQIEQNKISKGNLNLFFNLSSLKSNSKFNVNWLDKFFKFNIS